MIVFRPFGLKWWLWLSWISFCMTCAFSIKFVGLFTILLVGVRAIYDLWVILGDMSRPVVSVQFNESTFNFVMISITCKTTELHSEALSCEGLVPHSAAGRFVHGNILRPLENFKNQRRRRRIFQHRLSSESRRKLLSRQRKRQR